MRRLALLAALLLAPSLAHSQFIDGLPVVGVPPAPPLSASDILAVCQSGTVGRPGTCTPRQTTAGSLAGVIPGLTLSSPPPIGNVAPNVGFFTNLTVTGTVSGAGFTANFASPPPIGNVTPNSGAFTTLTATGQTTTKNLNLGNNQTITWSGSAQFSTALTPFYVSNSFNGTSTATSPVMLNRIGTEQDNIHGPLTVPINNLQVNHRFGGANTVGDRQTFVVSGHQNAATGDAAIGNDVTYVGAFLGMQADFNVGGTDTSIVNSRGHVFGSNPQALLFPGATFYNHLAGEEINVGTPNNVAYRSGLSVVGSAGAGKGQEVDALIWLYNGSGSTAWSHGILAGGPNSAWAFNATSSILGATTAAASVPQLAKWGVDFNEVSLPATGNSYEGGFLRSGGFSVDGAGRTRIGTTFLTPSATGLAIDAIGSVGTVVTGAGPINAGGTGYTTGTGTDVARDLYGGVYRLDVAAGVVTGVNTVIRQPVWPDHTTAPATSVTTTLGTATGGPGSGLVLNLTWNTTATTLALQPGGGATTAAGGLTVTGTTNSTWFRTPGSTFTVSGTTVPTRNLNITANWTGTSTLTGNTSAPSAFIGTATDNAAFNNGSRTELLIGGNYGGAAFNGGRFGMLSQMNWATASVVSGPGAGLIGYGSVVTSGVNAGGVVTGFGTTQFGLGSLFGANPWCRMNSGATFYAQCIGEEVDASIATGASAANFAIMQMVLTSGHGVHGLLRDAGISMAAQIGATVGVRDLITAGDYQSQFPVDPNGYLFSVRTGTPGSAAPSTSAGGFDLLQLTTSGAGREGGNFMFRSPGSGTVGATAIDGSGGIKVGSGYINANAAGLVLDAPLWVLSGTPTVVAGGTGYATGDLVGDSLGNVLAVTAAAGVVSAVSVYARAEGRAADASASPIATSPMTYSSATRGSGLTVGETWAQSTMSVQIGASGSRVGFYGTAPIVKQTGVAVTAAGIHAALTALGLIAP